MTGAARILELRSVWGTGGGPEKTIILSAAKTDRRRFAITVCYLRAAHDPQFRVGDLARAHDLDYTELLERHALDPSIWRSLRALVWQKRIQLVHSHDYKTDLLAWMLARSSGIIAMSTAHGWSGHSWRERWLYYPFDRVVLRRFPHVVAVSTDIKSLLVRAGVSADRVSIVLNGIDSTAFIRIDSQVSDARAAYDIPPGCFVLGSIGRLEKEKNYLLLIRVFRRVLNALPKAVLVVAGEGSQRSLLEEEMQHLGLDASQCRLIGKTGDVSGLHHALDVYVQTSDNEGTPNAILEAMALRTPIVATNVGGTAELARPDLEALIVPRGDEPALAAAILRVATDPLAAAERCQRARLRVEQELSFDARLQKVDAIYDKLLAAHSSR